MALAPAPPRAATPLLMLSSGLGLSTLATVALIQHNIRTHNPGAVFLRGARSFFLRGHSERDQMDLFRAW